VLAATEQKVCCPEKVRNLLPFQSVYETDLLQRNVCWCTLYLQLVATLIDHELHIRIVIGAGLAAGTHLLHPSSTFNISSVLNVVLIQIFTTLASFPGRYHVPLPNLIVAL